MPCKGPSDNAESWRRACGCMRTSDKLKQILKTFPEPPPPSPAPAPPKSLAGNLSATSQHIPPGLGVCPAFGANPRFAYTTQCLNQPLTTPIPGYINDVALFSQREEKEMKKLSNVQTSWQLVAELVSIIQLLVMATALALYYIIYCYMQLVYYILRSAVYFHHADGSMKLTIGVVTVTTLVVGFHILVRMEKFFGFIS